MAGRRQVGHHPPRSRPRPVSAVLMDPWPTISAIGPEMVIILEFRKCNKTNARLNVTKRAGQRRALDLQARFARWLEGGQMCRVG